MTTLECRGGPFDGVLLQVPAEMTRVAIQSVDGPKLGFVHVYVVNVPDRVLHHDHVLSAERSLLDGPASTH